MKMFQRKSRAYCCTDLAAEFAPSRSVSKGERISVSEVNVDRSMSEKIRRPIGRYVTVETNLVTSGETDGFAELASAISDELALFLCDCESVMIVALGNPDLTADSLGDKSFKLINMTRHLGASPSVCGVAPNVMGMTGIESYDVVKAVCEKVNPDAVLVIDALTAAAPERLGNVFQITDVGITPGSGVSNHRARLDRSTLNRKVITLGVPLVVYSTAFGGSDGEKIVVTPKDIDLIVKNAAYVVAAAVNMCFGNL